MNIHVGPIFIQYLQLSQAQDELFSDNTHYSTHLWISTALIVARLALFFLFVFLEALYRSISWQHSSDTCIYLLRFIEFWQRSLVNIQKYSEYMEIISHLDSFYVFFFFFSLSPLDTLILPYTRTISPPYLLY